MPAHGRLIAAPTEGYGLPRPLRGLAMTGAARRASHLPLSLRGGEANAAIRPPDSQKAVGAAKGLAVLR